MAEGGFTHGDAPVLRDLRFKEFRSMLMGPVASRRSRWNWMLSGILFAFVGLGIPSDAFAQGDVRGASTASCLDAGIPGGDGCQIITLAVNCLDLEIRTAKVRMHPWGRSGRPERVVILTTGEWGRFFFGGLDSQTRHARLVSSLWAGASTYEVSWPDSHGWATGLEGEGIVDPMCAFATLVHWIVQHAGGPDIVIATGNSAGSMQIAYGLAAPGYGLGSIIDLAVLTGGPPTTDVTAICSRAMDPQHIFINHVMGWNHPLSTFQCGQSPVPQFAQLAMDSESLVNAAPGWTYAYQTVLAFVQGQNDPDNLARGRQYFEAVQSEKHWIELWNVPHAVHQDRLGSETILSIIVNSDCSGGTCEFSLSGRE